MSHEESNPPGNARELDEFDLELMLAGAPTDPQLAARLAADPSLGPARDEIAALQGWWAANRPPLPERPPARPAPTTPWRWAAAAVAAAAVLAVALPLVQNDGVTFRDRGGNRLQVDLSHERADAPVPDGGAFAAEDVLGVALVVPHTGFVSVYTVQENGSASVLDVSRPADPTTAYQLGLQLDDYAGREWLVVEVTDAPQTQEQIVAQARELLPRPHGDDDQWVTEITRGKER